jgi:hypothetical protein
VSDFDLAGRIPHASGDPRQGLKDVVRANVRQLMVDMLADRVGHAYLLASGRFNWRQVFGRQMGAFYTGNMAGCDHLADVLFQFAEGMWRDYYQTPYVNGLPNPRYDGLSPRQLLDRVEYVSPPTQEEIDKAWRLDIEGDEQALRIFYEGSARTRSGNDLGARKTPLRQDEIRKIVERS